jgi:hypothetical protein
MNGFSPLTGRRYRVYLIGIPGLLALIAGLVLGAPLVGDRLLVARTAAVGRMAASVSLCLAGMMCITTSVVLNAVDRLGLEIEIRREVPAGYPGFADPPARRRGVNWALLLLVLPGSALLLAGLLWGGWALYFKITQVARFAGTYLASASCCLAGLTMVLSGMTLSALRDLMAEVRRAG